MPGKRTRRSTASRPASRRSGAPAPPRLGQTVQQLRTERGMTLDALSRVAGVSKSMLSDIERDKANPTIAVAWRLANALDIGLDRLLVGGQRTLEQVSVAGPHETPSLAGQNDAYVLRILGPIELAGRFEWYELALKPGGALVSSAHEPGTREHLTVIRGTIDVTAGDTTRTLKAGDTGRYFADREHAVRNNSKHEAIALMVVIHP
jgi:XRE family transcriptional regulator, regulator of sulfur utilization